MTAICGADCLKCRMNDKCQGCEKTGAKPFGGNCIASEYIKVGGEQAYKAFKSKLIIEINELLKAEGIPEISKLHELSGAFVNLKYTLPNGETVRFLDDKKIYLGCQVNIAETGICCGIVADAYFILICSYSVNGSEPEILVYKRR